MVVGIRFWVAVLSLLVLASGILAQPPEGRMGPIPPMMMRLMGTHEKCLQALMKDCGEFWHGAGSCHVCAQNHAQTLKQAKCTAADTHAFCTPNIKCEDGLTKHCSAVKHQGQPCWQCVGENSAELAAFGCTTAITHAFCSQTIPCEEGLFEICGEFLHEGDPCLQCVEQHKEKLRKCADDKIQSFCRKVTDPQPQPPNEGDNEAVDEDDTEVAGAEVNESPAEGDAENFDTTTEDIPRVTTDDDDDEDAVAVHETEGKPENEEAEEGENNVDEMAVGLRGGRHPNGL